MYVLIDMEWVNREEEDKAITQIALIRVDEHWQAVDRYYSRIAPKNDRFHLWTHVGYTGGNCQDFISAPSEGEVFAEIRRWLKEDDILCWWCGHGMEWFADLCAMPTLQSIVLSDFVFTHANGTRRNPTNAYRFGGKYGISAPGEMHFAKADAEMMRLVLEKLAYPQPLPDILAKRELASRAGAMQMLYVAHLDSNTIHKRECEYLPQQGRLKGYNDLKKPVAKGYQPCSCIKNEFYTARRLRNEDIISRTEYNFFYSPESEVFHRRGCGAILSATQMFGNIYYNKCVLAGRRPCKICKPSPANETRKQLPQRPKKTATKQKDRQLNKLEQQALNRHQRAVKERKAIMENESIPQMKKECLCTLSSACYAFFAAGGYNTFHLRNCKKLSGLLNLKGFAKYEEAERAGYRPCKCCKPSNKQDILISLPMYTRRRDDDSAELVRNLCQKYGISFAEENGFLRMETEVGIWLLNFNAPPYRLEHINLIKTPGNQTEFHRQPRLFLSLADAFYYIKRHDEGLKQNNDRKGYKEQLPTPCEEA